MNDCKACHGAEEMDLPLRGVVEGFPCPCCKPWASGFPGLGFNTVRGFKWIIMPSEPRVAAEWKGN